MRCGTVYKRLRQRYDPGLGWVWLSVAVLCHLTYVLRVHPPLCGCVSVPPGISRLPCNCERLATKYQWMQLSCVAGSS